MARVPAKSVSAAERDRIQTLEADLKAVIYGQDKAIEQVDGNTAATQNNHLS
jgi:ATP-dependent Clp protease ATP-binding subunit ClpA